jgi:hypothetical protein
MKQTFLYVRDGQTFQRKTETMEYTHGLYTAGGPSREGDSHILEAGIISWHTSYPLAMKALNNIRSQFKWTLKIEIVSVQKLEKKK